MADAPLSASITNLIREAHDNSKNKGFWDEPETAETIPSKLMLIVSEAAEALESYRDPASDNMVKVPSDLIAVLLGRPVSEGSNFYAADRMSAMETLEVIYNMWQAKPKGFDIEVADILIRCFDLAGRNGIDLDGALRTKMNYNKGRPPMHGGRRV